MKFYCIAYKANDIFYAKQTTEFLESDEKILIDFGQNSEKLKSGFTQTHNLRYKKKPLFLLGAIAYLSRKINTPKKYKSFLCSSNFQLALTRALAATIFKDSKLILIEDGIMNYRHEGIFMPGSFLEKFPNQALDRLGLSENRIKGRISSAYFLIPEKAKAPLNNKKRLTITNAEPTTNDLANLLSNKSVFIGQPLYKLGYIKKDLYTSRIKFLYKSGIIDIYIPHKDHSEDLEKYEFPVIDLQGYGQTLEMISSRLKNTKIITYCSSLAYTIPNLNPSTSAYFIEDSDFSKYKDIFELFKSINHQLTTIKVDYAIQ